MHHTASRGVRTEPERTNSRKNDTEHPDTIEPPLIYARDFGAGPEKHQKHRPRTRYSLIRDPRAKCTYNRRRAVLFPTSGGLPYKDVEKYETSGVCWQIVVTTWNVVKQSHRTGCLPSTITLMSCDTRIAEVSTTKLSPSIDTKVTALADMAPSRCSWLFSSRWSAAISQRTGTCLCSCLQLNAFVIHDDDVDGEEKRGDCPDASQEYCLQRKLPQCYILPCFLQAATLLIGLCLPDTMALLSLDFSDPQ